MTGSIDSPLFFPFRIGSIAVITDVIYSERRSPFAFSRIPPVNS